MPKPKKRTLESSGAPQVVVDLTPIDLYSFYENNKDYGNRYIDTTLLRQADNAYIAKQMGLPQRQAAVYTFQQEGNTLGDHGNGAHGMYGWRDDRAIGLLPTMDYQTNKFYNETYGDFNPNNWNHGGTGSGYMTGRAAQEAFKNATTVEEATRALNYGYVRPPLVDRIFRTQNASKMFVTRQRPAKPVANKRRLDYGGIIII